jgi:hypothetical protein
MIKSRFAGYNKPQDQIAMAKLCGESANTSHRATCPMAAVATCPRYSYYRRRQLSDTFKNDFRLHSLNGIVRDANRCIASQPCQVMTATSSSFQRDAVVSESARVNCAKRTGHGSLA